MPMLMDISIFTSEALKGAKCLDRIAVLWHNAAFRLSPGVCLSTASFLFLFAIPHKLPVAGVADAG